MKKCIIGCALSMMLSTEVMAVNSTVTLTGGGDVAAKSSVSISLNGLMSSVTYNIVCYIDAFYPFQMVKLASDLAGGAGVVTSYTLNGDLVTQGELIVGHNIAIITGNFSNPATASVIFTNLDQTNLFNVNNCYANAAVVVHE